MQTVLSPLLMSEGERRRTIRQKPFLRHHRPHRRLALSWDPFPCSNYAYTAAEDLECTHRVMPVSCIWGFLLGERPRNPNLSPAGPASAAIGLGWVRSTQTMMTEIQFSDQVSFFAPFLPRPDFIPRGQPRERRGVPHFDSGTTGTTVRDTWSGTSPTSWSCVRPPSLPSLSPFLSDYCRRRRRPPAS